MDPIHPLSTLAPEILLYICMAAEAAFLTQDKAVKVVSLQHLLLLNVLCSSSAGYAAIRRMIRKSNVTIDESSSYSPTNR